jgi:hypothetical protein
MGVFEMVVALVFIGTTGKVLAEYFRSSRRALPPGEERRIQHLEAELRSTEERLALTEDRVNDLSDKLGFVENLLANPERKERLRPPSPPSS